MSLPHIEDIYVFESEKITKGGKERLEICYKTKNSPFIEFVHSLK